VLLHEHVLAGDAEVYRARFDVGGNVARPKRQNRHLLAGEEQRARIRAERGAVDADLVEQVESLVEK
jgi:hypothetical protein